MIQYSGGGEREYVRHKRHKEVESGRVLALILLIVMPILYLVLYRSP